jgi:hypothetical protein
MLNFILGSQVWINLILGILSVSFITIELVSSMYDATSIHKKVRIYY